MKNVKTIRFGNKSTKVRLLPEDVSIAARDRIQKECDPIVASIRVRKRKALMRSRTITIR